MAGYRYRAFDASSKELSGIVDAESSRAALALLRERGWFPLEVVDLSVASQRRWWRASRLSDGELSLLTRQWSTLLASGLTLEQSLTALLEQADGDAARQLLASVRAEILAGYSLSGALDHFPRQFPVIYRASVAAGEKSGELDTVMLQLADHLERRNALRRKILQALLYPAIVAAVAVAVVIGLMSYVVPSIVAVLARGEQALPWLTRVVIALSGFVRQWGWLLVLSGLLSLAALHWSLRNRQRRQRWDAGLLRLPLLGRYLRTLDTARFASTLAILVGSGVPLISALEAGRQVVVRLPLRAAVSQATHRVREGMSLARALGQTGQFPPLLIHMIASGEATGQLQPLLERVARLQQGDLENRTAMLTTLMEPLLLLGMGLVVLTIVLAIMQPIIEINQLLR